MSKKKLGWCDKCKEYSTIVKITTKGHRYEICVNAGCKTVITLPPVEVKGLKNA